MNSIEQRLNFQLNTLDQIFSELTFKGLNHAKEKRAALAETYLKLAMRAQIQSVKTMEFLELKQSNSSCIEQDLSSNKLSSKVIYELHKV